MAPDQKTLLDMLEELGFKKFSAIVVLGLICAVVTLEVQISNLKSNHLKGVEKTLEALVELDRAYSMHRAPGDVEPPKYEELKPIERLRDFRDTLAFKDLSSVSFSALESPSAEGEGSYKRGTASDPKSTKVFKPSIKNNN